MLLIFALAAALLVQRIVAQESDAPGLEIEFQGVVERVNQNSIVINEREVDTSGIQILVPLQVGMSVRVSGTLLSDGQIMARDVLIVSGQAQTPLPAGTPEVLPDCTLSQNYWRAHLEAWPVNTLMLGAQAYQWPELLALFNMPARDDVSLLLAWQLIAAKLNVASGSDASTIGSTILQADLLLGAFPGTLPYSVAATSEEAQPMIAAATLLNDFNNQQVASGCDAQGAPASTPEVVPTVILEGSVQSISGNVITVQEIAIRVNPADPAFSVIHVGTHVRVEGSYGSDNVLNAISVTLLDAAPAPATTPEVSGSGGNDVPAPASTPEVTGNSGMGSDDSGGDDNSGMGSDDGGDDNSGMGSGD
jgi:hypothetical protein